MEHTTDTTAMESDAMGNADDASAMGRGTIAAARDGNAGDGGASIDAAGSIYGECAPYLPQAMAMLTDCITQFDSQQREATGEGVYEHFIHRIKSEESMREKCRRKGLPETPRSALHEIHDALGCRVVCSFVDDIYAIARHLADDPGFTVIETKDYVRHPKPNGYRSFHMIVVINTPFPDVDGRTPGHYPAEIQLRTIAMDSWAALEHKVKYKKDLGNANAAIVTEELKRCADELASCDLEMQTIRNLINEDNNADIIVGQDTKMETSHI